MPLLRGIKKVVFKSLKRGLFIKERGRPILRNVIISRLLLILMAESKVAKFHTRLAKKYDRAYVGNVLLDIGGIVEWNKLMKYLPKKKCNVLDAGGGTGEYSARFAKMGHDVVLTDVSSGMIREARKKIEREGLEGKITVLKQDICKMNVLKSGTFDFVISLGDPVSYCGDHKKAIAELARVAKKGAIVFIGVDSYYRTLARLAAQGRKDEIRRLERTGISMFKDSEIRIEYPQYNFKPDELSELYKQNGLGVIDLFGMANLANRMSKENLMKLSKNGVLFKTLIELELKYASEPSIVGAAGHLGIVGRKL
jgi:ubiquinone/menaquinone biosynthesis C-methylase UbiE